MIGFVTTAEPYCLKLVGKVSTRLCPLPLTQTPLRIFSLLQLSLRSRCSTSDQVLGHTELEATESAVHTDCLLGGGEGEERRTPLPLAILNSASASRWACDLSPPLSLSYTSLYTRPHIPTRYLGKNHKEGGGLGRRPRKTGGHKVTWGKLLLAASIPLF